MNDFLEPLESRNRRRSGLANALTLLTERRDGLERAIDDHGRFDLSRCSAELSRLNLVKEQISDNLAQAEKALRGESAELQKLEPQTVSLLKIVAFFSADQKLLRSKASAIQARIKGYKSNIERLNIERVQTTRTIDQASVKISEFQRFDLAATEDELRRVKTEIETASNDLAQLDGEITSLNARVGPHVAEYERLQARASTLKKTIAAAEGLDRNLNDAANGYERAQIHEACNARFGDGSPRRVLNDASRELRSIENNIPKHERRIREELKKSEMVVSHIIIDGNNTCYDRNNFIRLQALTHLVDELTKIYKVTVVFDASIRSLMKTDDAGIERIIGRSAAIHVAPTKTGADEFILRLADKRHDSYILSNDRFAEFTDYDVVKSGRLLRFLIADNLIMLNDLDMVVPFRS